MEIFKTVGKFISENSPYTYIVGACLIVVVLGAILAAVIIVATGKKSKNDDNDATVEPTAATETESEQLSQPTEDTQVKQATEEPLSQAESVADETTAKQKVVEEVKEDEQVEPKPVKKTQPKTSKPRTSNETAKPKQTSKKATKEKQENEVVVEVTDDAVTNADESKTKKDEHSSIYHVTKRKTDGKWQVKYRKGEKAIKLFDTQAEAIAYAKKLAANRDGSVTVHKTTGQIRKH